MNDCAQRNLNVFKHASVLDGMNPILIKQSLLLITMGLQTYMEAYDFNTNPTKIERMQKF